MHEQFCLTDLLEGILVESGCVRFSADDRFIHGYFHSCWDSGKYSLLRCCSFNVSGEYPQMPGIDYSLRELEQIKLILPTPDIKFFDVSSKIRGHYVRHVKKKLLPTQYGEMKRLAADFSARLGEWGKSSAGPASPASPVS